MTLVEMKLLMNMIPVIIKFLGYMINIANKTINSSQEFTKDQKLELLKGIESSRNEISSLKFEDVD